jgi:DNA-binding transcriptional MocR family regulator
MLMRSAAQSLTEQLAERFAARIRDRLLAPGSRLPSVRQCATQHQLSPSTVVAAYDQLLAQGLIEARPQRGFFVRDWTPKPALPSADGSPSAIEAGVSRRPGRAGRAGGADQRHPRLIRGMFHKISAKPQPGTGVFPPDWLESTFMPAAVRKVTSTRALQEFSLQVRRAAWATAACAACCLAQEGAGRAERTGAARARSSPPSAPPMRWIS